MDKDKETRISSTLEGEGWLASEDGEPTTSLQMADKAVYARLEKPDTRPNLCAGFSQLASQAITLTRVWPVCVLEESQANGRLRNSRSLRRCNDLAARNGSGHCGDATMPRDSPVDSSKLNGGVRTRSCAAHTAIGSKRPHALKIPARRAEYSLTENVASPFQAEPAHTHRAVACQVVAKNALSPLEILHRPLMLLSRRKRRKRPQIFPLPFHIFLPRIQTILPRS
jgi:hypothetical protein